MAKKKKKQTRAEPVSYLCSMEAYETYAAAAIPAWPTIRRVMAGGG